MAQALRSGGECYLMGGSAWILPVFNLLRAESVTTNFSSNFLYNVALTLTDY